MTKKELKARRRRIELAYYKTCSGVVIDVFDLPKVFEYGLMYLERMAPVDDQELESAICSYVRETLAPKAVEVSCTFTSETL